MNKKWSLCRRLCTYVYKLSQFLKGIFDHYFFCIEDSTWVHINRQQWFCELFRFCENIRSQGSKNEYAETQFFLDTEVLIFKIIAVGFENTPKYLFSPECSFKICEKPSMFSESVRVVFSVESAYLKSVKNIVTLFL